MIIALSHIRFITATWAVCSEIEFSVPSSANLRNPGWEMRLPLLFIGWKMEHIKLLCTHLISSRLMSSTIPKTTSVEAKRKTTLGHFVAKIGAKSSSSMRTWASRRTLWRVKLRRKWKKGFGGNINEENQEGSSETRGT